jgi:hypothetical protein
MNALGVLGKGKLMNGKDYDEGKRNGRAGKHAQSYSTTATISPVALFATGQSALRGLRRAGL